MSRLERAVNLLTALVETSRPLTRSELFERVPGYDGTQAARRAFERDKEMLRSMGVPVLTEEVDADNPEDQVGYRVPKNDYHLSDLGLTNEEVSALAIATAAVRVGEKSTAAALLKLGVDPDTSTQDDVDLRDDDRLADLFAARKDLRTATFDYHGKQRALQVHRLSFRRGRWYVSGHDLGYDSERTYRVDRIEGAVTLSGPNSFDAPVGSSQPWLPAWRIGETETPVVAIVAVDAGHVDIVAGQVKGFGSVEQLDDGSARISLEVLNREAFCAWVLDFLDHVEILEPISLRSEFVQQLERLVAK